MSSLSWFPSACPTILWEGWNSWHFSRRLIVEHHVYGGDTWCRRYLRSILFKNKFDFILWTPRIYDVTKNQLLGGHRIISSWTRTKRLITIVHSRFSMRSPTRSFWWSWVDWTVLRCDCIASVSRSHRHYHVHLLVCAACRARSEIVMLLSTVFVDCKTLE